MAVTVGRNRLSVVHKASSAITIAFPDVSRTPSPGGAVPIPYPAAAKTATKARAKSKPGQFTPLDRSKPAYQGNPGSQKAMASHGSHVETTQLKTLLGVLNTKLQNMDSNDPNVWQKVVQDYVVAAGALFVTRQND